MFEKLLAGIKVVVFDVDDTLLLWNHNKNKKWQYESCGNGIFIPDEYWDEANKNFDVYEDTKVNLVIRDCLLTKINEINKEAFKKNRIREIVTDASKDTSCLKPIENQIKVFALSADTSKYAMQNKTNKLMKEYPDSFYEENTLACDTPNEKIEVLKEICKVYKCNADEVLFVDDLQSTLIEVDKSGYRVETPQGIMQECVQVYFKK